MAIAKGFRCFGRIRLDETAIRVRQIHAKIMEPNLLATNVPVRLAKIRLRVAWAMAQWHENPMRRVPLLLVNLAVAFKNGVDPRQIRSKLLGCRPFTPTVSGRD